MHELRRGIYEGYPFSASADQASLGPEHGWVTEASSVKVFLSSKELERLMAGWT